MRYVYCFLFLLAASLGCSKSNDKGTPTSTPAAASSPTPNGLWGYIGGQATGGTYWFNFKSAYFTSDTVRHLLTVYADDGGDSVKLICEYYNTMTGQYSFNVADSGYCLEFQYQHWVLNNSFELFIYLDSLKSNTLYGSLSGTIYNGFLYDTVNVGFRLPEVAPYLGDIFFTGQ